MGSINPQAIERFRGVMQGHLILAATHSTTLTLAALNFVHLPARTVEPVIAAKHIPRLLERETVLALSSDVLRGQVDAVALKIRRIDCSKQDAQPAIAALRAELSPKGNVVSPESKARTIAAFGGPLSPRQVVERICTDVAARGLEAVLDYARGIDGVTLEPRQVRVSADELLTAHRQADPVYLETLARVRGNVLAYQEAIRHHDVMLPAHDGIELGLLYRPIRRVGVCIPGGTAAYPSTLFRLTNAGAIFLGHFAPVAAGDYAAGPSHVLPTGGTARWASGLSANDFLKRSSLISLSRDGLAELAPDIRLLADKEGLSAHRSSVDLRLDYPSEKGG